MNKLFFYLFVILMSVPFSSAVIDDADIFLDFENPSDLDQNNGSVSTTWNIGSQTHETTDAIYGDYSIDTDGINQNWNTTDVSFGNGASDSFTYCLWFQHDTLPSTTWIPVQGVDAGNDNWDVRFLHSTNTWSINARTSTGTGTWVDVDDTNLHSFCAVLDNSDNTFQLWFDGVNEANGTFSSYDVIDQLVLFNDKNGGQQGDSVIDLIGVWSYAFTPAQVAEYYNSGTPWNPYASSNTVTPSWVAPTPIDAAVNNTQVVLNASSVNAESYFVWFDTNPDPITLVVNNATSGNWTTNVSSATQTYYYKAQAWNSTLGYSVNTSVRSWTFDAVEPSIVLNPSNEFNSNGYAQKNQYDDEIPLNITFTDDNDLYAYSINITLNGTSTVYYNETNESLSGTSYTYTNTLNSSSWPVGVYQAEVMVSDSHTAREINDYDVAPRRTCTGRDCGDGLLFRTAEGNTVEIVSDSDATTRTFRQADRYEFEFDFADEQTSSRLFHVRSDKPIVYRPDSSYKAHFVIFDGRGGNWVDFEGVSGEPVVVRVDDFHYTVSFDSLPSRARFSSIGGLNVLSVNYTFYQGEANTSSPASLALEPANIRLNITTASSISDISAFLDYNGTTYNASVVNSSSLYEFVVPVMSFNGSANLSYFWNVTTVQGDGNITNFNVSGTHSVTDWSIVSCGTPFINWTQYDEDVPLTKITGSFALEVTYWVGNVSNAKLYNHSYGSADSWELCFTPVDAIFYANIYGQNVVPGGFTHRFYVQNGSYSSNVTYYSLYNPNSSNAQSLYSDMKITARNEDNYAYFENVFAHLQRLYVGQGVWRTVQYDKSGDFGLIFFDIIEENVDYRIRYYDENNNLLKSTESLKFVCTSSVCELTQLLNPSGSVSTNEVYANWTYDNATSVITIDWDTLSSVEADVALSVTKRSSLGETSICSVTQTGVAGTYDCNVTGYTGELFVSVDLDEQPSVGGYVSTVRASASDFLSPGMSALVTFILMLTIIGFGLFSPMALVITTVLSLIITFFTGTTPYVDMTFVTVAAAIGLAISMKVKQ